MSATEQGEVSPAFRLTPQRAAVLDVIQAAHDHPTARDIYQRVKGRVPGIGFATVYRTLNLLVEHGAVLELQLGDDPVARYDGNTGHHDHVLCARCGAIGDLEVGVPDSVLREAANQAGYEISGYELQFFGRCPSCREREAAEQSG